MLIVYFFLITNNMFLFVTKSNPFLCYCLVFLFVCFVRFCLVGWLTFSFWGVFCGFFFFACLLCGLCVCFLVVVVVLMGFWVSFVAVF